MKGYINVRKEYMKLVSINYGHLQGTEKEWILENSVFEEVTLIVGKNASGKSKTINLIVFLANILCGDSKPRFLSGSYNATFSDNNIEIKYLLEMKNNNVLKEEVEIDGISYLTRNSDGTGRIYNEPAKQMIDFQIPENESAVYSKRDLLQHPSLEKLVSWGKNLRFYYFGTDFGKSNFAIYRKDIPEIQVNLKHFHDVIEIYRLGKKEFQDKFDQSIFQDMNSLDYELEEIKIDPIQNLKVLLDNVEDQVHGLQIKEKNITHPIEQNSISQGMFRALSLIIQLNYSQLKGITSFILIDDIGEGLDYERSSSLIELIVKKTEQSKTQLIMTTNDRFVMNHVPLKYWSVIQRKPGKSTMYNYKNSKEIFDQFEYTGLNNFDFFSTDFYKNGLQLK
jgi:energy-coupling factor transporter ATP-binding protein EcfA2